MEITLTTWGQEATAAEVMGCVAWWGMLSFWLLLSRGDTLHSDATQATAARVVGAGGSGAGHKALATALACKYT